MNRSTAQKHRHTKFDPTPFLEAIGAKPIVEKANIGHLPNGQAIAVNKGNTPGKVALHRVDAKDEGRHFRSFNAGDLEAMREWANGGGKIASEQRAKDIKAAAFDLLDALTLALHAVDGGHVPAERMTEIRELAARLAK